MPTLLRQIKSRLDTPGGGGTDEAVGDEGVVERTIEVGVQAQAAVDHVADLRA